MESSTSSISHFSSSMSVYVSLEGVLVKVAFMPAAFMFSILGCLNIKNNNDKEVNVAQCNTFQMFPMKRSQIDSEESTEESEQSSSSRNSATGDRKKKNYRPPNDNETVDECASDWEKPVERTPGSAKTQADSLWRGQEQPAQQPVDPYMLQTKTARPSAETTTPPPPLPPPLPLPPPPPPPPPPKKKAQPKLPKDAVHIYNGKGFLPVKGAKVQQKQKDRQPAAAQVPKGITVQKQQQYHHQQHQQQHHQQHQHQRKHHHDQKHTKQKSQKMLDPYFYSPDSKSS